MSLDAKSTALIARLRSVSQRVAEQSRFNTYVGNLEAHLGDQAAQRDVYLKLLCEPEVSFVAADGTSVPACRAVLARSSAVLERMLSSPLGFEGTTNVVTRMCHLPRSVLSSYPCTGPAA